ncbi:MAG: trigger factor [Actinomycetota bacterium]|nr:trigger factor [Actinomycetota bacterium]
MKTTVEEESPTKRKLLVEVTPDELAEHYDETLKRLGREVKVPGFRKGKVPRAIIESRMGREALREEVLKDALPNFYSKAAEDQALKAVTYPKIEVTSNVEGQDLTFTATVEVRPDVEVSDYKGIEVMRPPSSATEEELSAQLERLRDRFGTLEEVPRNAADGDYVVIDIHAYKHDDKIESASTEDLLYEVGSAGLVSELDSELRGKRAGDILQFNAVLPERFGEPHGGQEVSFRIMLKQVQAKRLPELNDEFAKTASEFDTFDELKTDLRQRIEAVKKIESDIMVRNRIIEELLDRVDVEVPESMIMHEMEHRLSRLLRDIEQAGSNLESYLQATGSSQEELVDAYKKAAERTIAADFVLEQIAEEEGITVTSADIESEISALAARVEKQPDEVLKDVAKSGNVNALAGDILRRKALEFLVENADIKEEAS